MPESMNIKERVDGALSDTFSLENYSEDQLDLENILGIPSGLERVARFTKQVEGISEQIHGKALEDEDAALSSIKSFLSEQGYDFDQIADNNETVSAVRGLIGDEGVSMNLLEDGVKGAAKKSSKLLFNTFKTMIEGKATKSVGGKIVPMKLGEFVEQMQEEFRGVLNEIPILGAIFNGAYDLIGEAVMAYRSPAGTVKFEGKLKGNYKDFCRSWREFRQLGKTEHYDYPKIRKKIFDNDRDSYRHRAPYICTVKGRETRDILWMLDPSETDGATQPEYAHKKSAQLFMDDWYWMETEGMRLVGLRWVPDDMDLFNTGVTPSDVPPWMPLWFPGVDAVFVGGTRLKLLTKNAWDTLAQLNPMTGIAPIGTPFESLSDEDKQAYIYNSIVIAVARHGMTHNWHKFGESLGAIHRLAEKHGIKTDLGLDFVNAFPPDRFGVRLYWPGDHEVWDSGTRKDPKVSAGAPMRAPGDRPRIVWDQEKIEAALTRLAYSGTLEEVQPAFSNFQTGLRGGSGGSGGGVAVLLAGLGLGYLGWRYLKGRSK